MKRRNVIAYFALVSLPVYADVENSIDQSILKEEFNISDYWHDGMSWEEFLEVRNGLRREGLIKYVDKIEQQKMAKDLGLEVPKTYIASRDKVPFVDIISALPSYVAKSDTFVFVSKLNNSRKRHQYFVGMANYAST